MNELVLPIYCVYYYYCFVSMIGIWNNKNATILSILKDQIWMKPTFQNIK